MLLSGCNVISAPSDSRTVMEISGAVLTAINATDLPKIAQESAALKQRRESLLRDPDLSSGGCATSELRYSKYIEEGAGWARQWHLGKSEGAARALIANPAWYDQLTETKDNGSCHDRSFVSVIKNAKNTFLTLRQKVNLEFPDLLTKIKTEKIEAAKAAEKIYNDRYANCDLDDAEQQRVFNLFVRFEDEIGKDNEAIETEVGNIIGILPSCVRHIMIQGLESGRQPPDRLL